MSTFDQHRLLTMYINQYNQTNTHIDSLLNMLDEIKANIINIIHPRTLINRDTHNHRHHNTNRYNNNRYQNNNNNNNRHNNRHYNNRQDNNTRYHNANNNNRHQNNRHHNTNDNNNNRHNNTIFYDYNNPISPAIYNDFFTRRDNVFTTQNNEAVTNFFQNFLNTTEIVSPTNEQIQNASRIIRYGSIVNPLSQSCPISLDEFQENNMVRQLLHCGHLFHQTQFDEWFQNNVRCPVCRYDIRNYTSTNTNEHLLPTNEDTSNNNTNTNSNSINQIEHVTFDLTNEQFSDIFNSLARNIFQSTLNSNTHNNNNNNNNNSGVSSNNNRSIDPSNNIV